jgi:hypothetical protein
MSNISHIHIKYITISLQEIGNIEKKWRIYLHYRRWTRLERRLQPQVVVAGRGSWRMRPGEPTEHSDAVPLIASFAPLSSRSPYQACPQRPRTIRGPRTEGGRRLHRDRSGEEGERRRGVGIHQNFVLSRGGEGRWRRTWGQRAALAAVRRRRRHFTHPRSRRKN